MHRYLRANCDQTVSSSCAPSVVRFCTQPLFPTCSAVCACSSLKEPSRRGFSNPLLKQSRRLLRAFESVVTNLVRSIKLSWKPVAETGEQCCESVQVADDGLFKRRSNAFLLLPHVSLVCACMADLLSLRPICPRTSAHGRRMPTHTRMPSQSHFHEHFPALPSAPPERTSRAQRNGARTHKKVYAAAHAAAKYQLLISVFMRIRATNVEYLPPHQALFAHTPWCFWG